LRASIRSRGASQIELLIALRNAARFSIRTPYISANEPVPSVFQLTHTSLSLESDLAVAKDHQHRLVELRILIRQRSRDAAGVDQDAR
jgi:hypothetical protein